MKKQNRTIIKYQLVVSLLFFTIFAQAQPGFENDTLDVPAAPINDWVLLLGVLGILLTYYVYKRRVISKIN